MPDGQFDANQVAQDESFRNASMTDRVAYLSANDPSFAKANPQDRAGYINHLLGNDQPTKFEQSGGDTPAPGIGDYVSTLGSELKGMGKSALQIPAYLSGSKTFQGAVEPQGVAEKVGAGVEQGVEMAAGEGLVKNALMKIPALAKYAPWVRIVSSTAGAAAPPVGRGENPTVPAAIGAATAGVGEAVPAIADALKGSAAKNYEDVLNPTKQGTKFQTQKIMPQLLEERPIAASRQGLQTKAEGMADQYGQQIEQKVNSLTGSMNAKPIIDGLDNLRNKFMVNGVNLRPEVSTAIDTAQDQMRQMAQGGQLPYQDAVKARRILDQAVADSKGWGGYNISDASLTNVRKEFSNSLRSEISKANPDLAALNSKFSFWKNLSDVMEATNARKTGQVGAFSKLQTVIAAGAGVASGGLSAGVEAGAAMKVLNSTINSTGWNTVSAATKSAVSDALATGKFNKVIELLGKTGAAASMQSSAPNSTP
jgi:hypothetical protein